MGQNEIKDSELNRRYVADIGLIVCARLPPLQGNGKSFVKQTKQDTNSSTAHKRKYPENTIIFSFTCDKTTTANALICKTTSKPIAFAVFLPPPKMSSNRHSICRDKGLGGGYITAPPVFVPNVQRCWLLPTGKRATRIRGDTSHVRTGRKVFFSSPYKVYITLGIVV
jgi:hypothetical protein